MIWCCCCRKEINPRLTNGTEIYPARRDLALNPYWICDTCRNFVGCHHRSSDPTRPLGSIPTPELRKARSELHQKLDPAWRHGNMSRREVYRLMGRLTGKGEFHVGDIRTLDEAVKARTAAARVLSMSNAE